MKKTPVLYLFLAVLLCSSAAQARICFLADLDCQQGVFDTFEREIYKCTERYPNAIHQDDRCSTKTYQSVCNDNYGNYYLETGCMIGYTDMDDPNNSAKYDCLGITCDRCCPNDKVVCKDNYKLCREYPPTIPDVSSETCLEPDGDIADTKYERCICETEKGKYPYNYANCGEEGLVTGGEECHGDNGSWYEKCECDTSEGFRETKRSDVVCPDSCQPHGCVEDWDEVTDLPGSSNVCWDGALCYYPPARVPQQKCPRPQQSDFDTFWCGYDVRGDNRNINSDCASLGYNTGTAATGIRCKNGSEPYRCMFDHTKVYCESGLCKYSTEAVCKSRNPNSYCNPNSVDICYNPTACKPGYYKYNCAHLDNYRAFYITGTDDFGCGTCVTDCDWVSESACEAANAHYECSINSQYCYVPTECKVGYKEENSACVECTCTEPNKDNYFNVLPSDCEVYGNYEGCISTGILEFDEDAYNAAVAEYEACLAECKLTWEGDSCDFNSKATCEGVNFKSECVQSGECWVPSGCKDGQDRSCSSPYNLTGKDPNGCGTCTTDCEYTDQTSCENAYSHSECSADSSGCYNPSGCKSPYVDSCDSGYNLEDKDANGCGTCTTNCAYTTQSTCENAYSHSECSVDSNGCYNPSGCKGSYVKECTQTGYFLTDSDSNGCGTCTTNCAYTTQSACESARANVECGLENGCYVAMRCKTGYVAVKR